MDGGLPGPRKTAPANPTVTRTADRNSLAGPRWAARGASGYSARSIAFAACHSPSIRSSVAASSVSPDF